MAVTNSIERASGKLQSLVNTMKIIVVQGPDGMPARCRRLRSVPCAMAKRVMLARFTPATYLCSKSLRSWKVINLVVKVSKSNNISKGSYRTWLGGRKNSRR